MASAQVRESQKFHLAMRLNKTRTNETAGQSVEIDEGQGGRAALLMGLLPPTN